MARVLTVMDTSTGTGSAPVGVTAISNGKPLSGVAVEITTVNTVKRGKTGYDGTFTALIRPGDPVEIWVKKEGVNLGSGTGMWFNVARVPGYARMSASPVRYTVSERPPAAGAGAMSMGVVDIGGWFTSVISNPLGALTSLPGFKQVAQAGAAVGAAAKTAGSQVAATPVARQVAQTVSGGAYTTSPTVNRYTPVTVNTPVSSIKPTPSAPQTFDLFKAISDANKAINKYNPFIVTAFPEPPVIVTTPTPFQGVPETLPNTQTVPTPSPESMRDTANSLTKTTEIDTALSNAKQTLDAQVKEAMDKGMAGMALIPSESAVSNLDVLIACGVFPAAGCAQNLYNTKNAARIAAVKAWQANVQAASMVPAPSVAQILNAKTVQFFTPTTTSKDVALGKINESLRKGQESSVYYENVLAQSSGISPVEIKRLTTLIAVNNSLLLSGHDAASLSGSDITKILQLGLDPTSPIEEVGVSQREVRTAGGDTGVPDIQNPLIPTVVPTSGTSAGIAPAGWQIRQTPDPDTIIGIDPNGNQYYKYRKGDWRLVQSSLSTPEQVPLGVTAGSTKDVGSGQNQVAVTNPVTGAMWTGNESTISLLAGGLLPKPITLNDGTVVTTCAELAARDPGRRQGAAWDTCESSEAWRVRNLYTLPKGGVQQDAIAALLQSKLAGAGALAGEINARVAAGIIPPSTELDQYKQNIAAYQAKMAQITGVTGFTLSSTQKQVAVQSPSDLINTITSIDTTKTIPDTLLQRKTGAVGLP